MVDQKFRRDTPDSSVIYDTIMSTPHHAGIDVIDKHQNNQ